MAGGRKMFRNLYFWLILFTLFGVLLVEGACTRFNQEGQLWNSGDDALNRLSLRLNSKYKRTLEKNNYSLAYLPKEPNTVVIRIRYRNPSELGIVRQVAFAAENQVRGVAAKEFQINVLTEIDLQLEGEEGSS